MHRRNSEGSDFKPLTQLITLQERTYNHAFFSSRVKCEFTLLVYICNTAKSCKLQQNSKKSKYGRKCLPYLVSNGRREK